MSIIVVNAMMVSVDISAVRFLRIATCLFSTLKLVKVLRVMNNKTPINRKAETKAENKFVGVCVVGNNEYTKKHAIDNNDVDPTIIQYLMTKAPLRAVYS